MKFLFSFLCVFLVLLAALGAAADQQARGTLSVRLHDFDSDRGEVVVKLFVQGDDVPKGRATRRLVGAIDQGRAEVEFQDLPYGTYAIFAFHDENGNGTVDHGFLGIPKESLGFSNGFRVTIWSGIPGFEDLRFRFSNKDSRQVIRMR